MRERDAATMLRDAVLTALLLVEAPLHCSLRKGDSPRPSTHVSPPSTGSANNNDTSCLTHSVTTVSLSGDHWDSRLVSSDNATLLGSSCRLPLAGAASWFVPCALPEKHPPLAQQVHLEGMQRVYALLPASSRRRRGTHFGRLLNSRLCGQPPWPTQLLRGRAGPLQRF